VHADVLVFVWTTSVLADAHGQLERKAHESLSLCTATVLSDSFPILPLGTPIARVVPFDHFQAILVRQFPSPQVQLSTGFAHR